MRDRATGLRVGLRVGGGGDGDGAALLAPLTGERLGDDDNAGSTCSFRCRREKMNGLLSGRPLDDWEDDDPPHNGEIFTEI